MTSRLLRRSGIAVCLVAELLDWHPDIVIQAGVGDYHAEIDVMREAWPGVMFIGFEANPRIYSSLLADYPGMLYRMALGKAITTVDVYEAPRHRNGSSLFRFKDKRQVNTYNVPMRTLDVMIKSDSDTLESLLWLDCEGSELNVLRGGTRVLSEVSVVNVEMTSNPPCEEWPRPKDVHDYLITRNFKLQWIHTQRTSAGQYDAIYVRPHLFRPEYCCCPCQLGGSACPSSI